MKQFLVGRKQFSNYKVFLLVRLEDHLIPVTQFNINFHAVNNQLVDIFFMSNRVERLNLSLWLIFFK